MSGETHATSRVEGSPRDARRVARINWYGWLAAAPLIILPTAWSTLAIAFCLPGPAPLRTTVAILPTIAVLFVAARNRSPWRALGASTIALAAGLAVLWSRAPSHDRDWSPDLARLPSATFEGDLVTVRNIRACRDRSETDYDAVWHDEVFDLSRLTGVDLFQVFWGSPLVAHTMLSFGFDDGRRLGVSVETRREKGESYDALRSLFRQYELIYIFGDESDLVRLRTNFRGEEVYRYPLRVPIDKVREVLVACLLAANDLEAHPRWYGAITENCTTTLIWHALPLVQPEPSLDWRMVANGHLHEMLYERGRLDASLPLEELRRRAFMNERALACPDDADFGECLRAP